MRASIKHAVLASALSALLLVAAATDKASDLPAGITPDAGLLDSYIQLTKPKMFLSPKQSGREGRTTLTLQLSQQTVGQFMPTSSPEVQGLTFDVLNTWDALKSMAQAYRHADEANRLRASDPVFPKTSLAARTASVATPPPEATTTAAAAAAAANSTPRRNWFVSFPPNLMMVPFGSSTAAIADVLDVAYDEGASAITLQLDVVHDPVVFSQFIPNHTPHSVDTKAAHYHFATRPGMAVDAPGLLKSLKESNYSPAGLHVFLKSEPLQSCYQGTMSPDAATITIGGTVNGTVTVDYICKSKEVVDGGYVTLELTGRGDFTALSINPNTKASKSPSRKKQPGRRQGDTLTAQAYVSNGQATFTVEATGEGTITVEATRYGFDKTSPLDPVPTLTITVEPAGPAVTTLLLQPAKAYRHCGDALTLTAYAFDSTGAHVPDANVTFAAFGECNPTLSATSALTNAEGAATVTLDAHQHGAVAVVAAVAVDGGVVTSKPAHVIFFDDHISYTDERERDYYAAGGEHYRYEREAAKLAEQHALGAPVTTSN